MAALFWYFVSSLIGLFGLCPQDMAPVQYFCIDKYEAPNIEGAMPMVMQSALDGNRWCAERGKRLCTEDEWDAACELSSGPCNNDKQWVPWSKVTVNSKNEIARLWQGAPSGSYSECRTMNGVYDLLGNVEEWAVSRKGRDWPYTLKGGWWAHITKCHKSNDFHEPTFQFYETGFRCCRSILP